MNVDDTERFIEAQIRRNDSVSKALDSLKDTMTESVHFANLSAQAAANSLDRIERLEKLVESYIKGIRN